MPHGHAPNTKNKAKALVARQKILMLIGEGQPVSKIAESLGLTVQTVRAHLRKALATESLYPGSLSGEKVAELRQMIAERLDAYNRKLSAAALKAATMLNDPNPKVVCDAIGRIAQCAQSAATLGAELAKLFGLYQPVKIIEESLRLQVTKSEHKVTISWDPSLLAAPAEPVPGLFIGRALAGVGDTLESLGDTRAELEPGFEGVGKVRMTTGAPQSPPETNVERLAARTKIE